MVLLFKFINKLVISLKHIIIIVLCYNTSGNIQIVKVLYINVL